MSLDAAVWPPAPQHAASSWFLPKLAQPAKVRNVAMAALMTALDVAPTLGVLVRTLDDETLPLLHRWRLLAELLHSPHFTSDAFRIRKDFDFARWCHTELARGPLLDATAARFYLVLMRRDRAEVPWLALTARSWAPDARSERGREAVARRPIASLHDMVVPRLTPAKILGIRPWLVGVPLGAAPTKVDEQGTHARLEVAAGLWCAGEDEPAAVTHFRAALALDPEIQLPPARWMPAAKYERIERLIADLRG